MKIFFINGLLNGHEQAVSDSAISDQDFLYRHRLKRSLDVPPFARPSEDSSQWGSVFTPGSSGFLGAK